jgi:hypothetical protein
MAFLSRERGPVKPFFQYRGVEQVEAAAIYDQGREVVVAVLCGWMSKSAGWKRVSLVRMSGSLSLSGS